jgi:hypothetical protein
MKIEHNKHHHLIRRFEDLAGVALTTGRAFVNVFKCLIEMKYPFTVLIKLESQREQRLSRVSLNLLRLKRN